MNPLPRLRSFTVFLFVAGLAALPLCAATSSSTFASLGGNTYAYTREASTTFSRNVEPLIAEAKADAARYCAEQGKQPKIIAVDVRKPWIATGFCRATVTFKPVDAGDPDLAVHDEVVTTTRDGNASRKTDAAPAAAAASPTSALYADLLKLDDLRKKGILTEEEFQAEKRKLLNRSK